MAAFFSALFAKLTAIVEWFSGIFVAIFVAAWDFIKDAFSWLFDSVLDVVISALAGIDTAAMEAATVGGWGSLPSDIVNILSLIGVGQAVTIIGSAIVIRLGLQLIPFVRLGS